MKRRFFVYLHILAVLAMLGLTGCSRTAEDVEKWKASGNVEKLIKALADPKYEVRLPAAEALGELKAERAVDSLAALYNDPETDIVMAAVEALANIATPSTITPLSAALKLEPVESRKLAAETLGKMKAVGAVPQLTEALGDADESVQLAAALSIGQIGDESGSEGLAGKLNAASSELRKTCAVALGQTGGETAIKALIPALADQNNGVASAAKESLLTLGEPTIPYMLDALKAKELPVRKGALFVLRKLEAVPDAGAYRIWYQLARVSVDADEAIDQGVVNSLIAEGVDAADILLEAAAHPVGDFREHATLALEHFGEAVLELVTAAVDIYATAPAKKWLAARGSWAGAPSWRIDLWAGIAALDPTFSLNKATVNSFEMQARPAFNILVDPQFSLTREYVPLLIALLGDTTMPPPAEPDYDADGIPTIKTKRDMFRGEANRQLAAEKLAAADYRAALPLIAAIEDENELIASNAADILGKLGDKRALEPLMHVVQTKLEAGEALTHSPFYIALQKMNEPEAEPLLLKIRPNADRAMHVFDRKYADIRPVSAETKDTSTEPDQPVNFRIGFIDRGRIGELIVTFTMNAEGNWIPNPPLPDERPAMQ